MDEFRCCKCPKSQETSEVFDSGSNNMAMSEDDALDLQKIQQELVTMEATIAKYKEQLGVYFDPCPSEDCVDYQIELDISKNEEIAKLQRSQYRLQIQMKELVSCCNAAKGELVHLRSLICEKSDQLHNLQKHGAALESWRRTLEHEAGLCIERFEYLKNSKAEWADVMKMVGKDQKNYAAKEKGFVPKNCFVKDKKYFIEQIARLTRMFKDLFELQHMPFVFPAGTEAEMSDFELRGAEKDYYELKNKIIEKKNAEKKDDCE